MKIICIKKNICSHGKKNLLFLPSNMAVVQNLYSRFSHDVTAAMLVYSTITKKVFWEFDSIIMQNLSDILPLFCPPTWTYHVSEKQQ